MKRLLSDRLLRGLTAPQTARFEIWDTAAPGFGVRGQGGTVAFFAMGRQRGSGNTRPIRITIGRYPLLPLIEARARARGLLRDLADGVDPREREAERLRAETQRRANTFQAVAEEFIARHVVKMRTARDVEPLIRRELIARWGDRPITDITRRDAIGMVEEIVDSGRPEMARQVLTYAKRLFGWAISRDVYGLEHAPTDRVKARDLIGTKQARQRVLTDSELALVWRAAAAMAYPDGPYVRLLLLLGSRRNELAFATWDEFDLDKRIWMLGGARMKTGMPHVVPLPAAAVEILQALPRFADSRRLFTVPRGSHPLGDFDRVKKGLDQRVAELNGGQPIEHWTFHDCRRTFRTGLSSLGVAPHIAELCIAHKQRGLVAVYDTYRFERERRDAMERWAAHLLATVNPSPENVVPLRKRP